ncbi:hypothetical protein [Streptomyces sp. NPDC046862]
MARSIRTSWPIFPHGVNGVIGVNEVNGRRIVRPVHPNPDWY